MGSQGMQPQVSTDLLARCSRAPHPSPAPFAWRRGGPRLQSSLARRGPEAGGEGWLPGHAPPAPPPHPSCSGWASTHRRHPATAGTYYAPSASRDVPANK